MVGARGGYPGYPSRPSYGVWGSAVSSPIGVWCGAPEALQLYYTPIMKRVRKSSFHRLGFALFNNNKTHMFTVLVYAW